MQMLPNSTGGKPTGMEKIIRYGVPLALAGLGFYFWGTISAFVAETMKNTFKMLLYGIPTAIVLGMFILYPTFWWMQYKILCKKVTGFFIKSDPLSFMDRYAEILSEKLANLKRVKVQLEGRKVKTQRRLEELDKQLREALKMGKAAIEQKQQNQASLYGTRAQGAKQSIDLLTPGYQKLVKSLEFMNTLADNWEVSIISLKEEIQRKREEYETLRENARALGQAEGFLTTDTEEGRIYQESLRALEESVTQKIAYIEDFEKRAKGTMDGIAVENQAHKDEGFAMLEQYMQDGKLVLPTNFAEPLKVNNTIFKNTTGIQELSCEEVKKGNFDLLK